MTEMESPEHSFYLSLSDDKFNPIAIKFIWHLGDIMSTGDGRDRMEKEEKEQTSCRCSLNCSHGKLWNF